MKRIALTALGLLLATAGAHAQTSTGTINGSGNGSYNIGITESDSPLPTQYTYTYTTVLNSISPGISVDTLTFNFGSPTLTYVAEAGSGYTLNPGSVSGPTDKFFFTGIPGMENVGDTAVFTFTSPLPPAGAVALATTADNGNVGGGTGFIIAPGVPQAAVPEAGPLALLTAGILPLALFARRRAASRS